MCGHEGNPFVAVLRFGQQHLIDRVDSVCLLLGTETGLCDDTRVRRHRFVVGV